MPGSRTAPASPEELTTTHLQALEPLQELLLAPRGEAFTHPLIALPGGCRRAPLLRL